MSNAYRISPRRYTSSMMMTRPTTTSVISSCVLYLMFFSLLNHISHCHAGWIDPDTPQDARTVYPFKVVPAPPAPKENGKSKNENSDKKSTTNHRRRRDPTQSPTLYPTFEPTQFPSIHPTSFTPAPTLPKRYYDLVFSDEFNTPHRNFADGHDPKWTALEKNDYTNDAQHYYSTENAYTDTQGNLVIKSEAADTDIVGFNDVKQKNEKVTKHFKSAMLQSWNKFCFTGGIMEAEIALPGRHDVGGLWPAFWLLGNLARHTYVGSSEHVWPWSSSVCTDKSRTAQLISACDRVEHYGLHTGVGRGAPEIDVFEVQAGSIKANTGAFLKMPVGQPFMSSSYQVAPGRLPRPGEGWWPYQNWYNNLTGGMNTSLNIIFYGTYNHFRDDTNPAEQDYWSDAISYNRQLNSSHFGKFHRYRVEWEVPEEASKENNYTKNYGYIRWYLDEQFVLEVKGEGLNASGTGAEISSEPMYMLLNTAISSQWGFPQKCPSNCPCKTYNCYGGYGETCGFSEGFCDMITDDHPVEYKINWVRVYQDKNDPKQKVGCSTPERPTRKFIEAHKKKYMQKGDSHPLKPIRNGGGECSPVAPKNETLPQNCGGLTRGKCDSSTNPSTCSCTANWTGPHCLNPVAYDDIIWDPVETWADIGFFGPVMIGPTLVMLVAALVGFVVIVGHIVLNKQKRRRSVRMKGYSRIPEYERRVGA